MEANEYIQKYGDKAVQTYLKSLRNSYSLDAAPSPRYSIPRKATSKNSIRQSASLKNVRQPKVSIKKEPSKKLAASGKKTPLNVELGHAKKGKLALTQATTPKCVTPPRRGLHSPKMLSQSHLQRLQQELTLMSDQKSLHRVALDALECIHTQDPRLRSYCEVAKTAVNKIYSLCQPSRRSASKSSIDPNRGPRLSSLSDGSRLSDNLNNEHTQLKARLAKLEDEVRYYKQKQHQLIEAFGRFRPGPPDKVAKSKQQPGLTLHNPHTPKQRRD